MNKINTEVSIGYLQGVTANDQLGQQYLNALIEERVALFQKVKELEAKQEEGS